MGTVGYVRVARDEGDEALLQKRDIEEFAKRENLTISEIYVDANFSGSSFNRPSFQQMLSELEKGNIEAILTRDHARISRNMSDLLTFMDKLEQLNITLYTLV